MDCKITIRRNAIAIPISSLNMNLKRCPKTPYHQRLFFPSSQFRGSENGEFMAVKMGPKGAQ